MIRTFRSLIVAALIGMLGVLAPGAAHAASIYPPIDACATSSASASAGETFTFSCRAGTFSANEPVTVTVTGENGAGVTFAFVRFAVSTASTSRTSDATGALPAVSITLPADASGVYNIAAVSPTSAGGAASTSTLGADGLPSTGGDSAQLIGVWIGGGALLLAGVVVLVTVVLRRRRDDD